MVLFLYVIFVYKSGSFVLKYLSVHAIFTLMCTSIKFLCVYKYCLVFCIYLYVGQRTTEDGRYAQLAIGCCPSDIRICYQRVMFNVLSTVLYVGQRTSEDGRYAQLAIGCCPSDVPNE